MLFLAEEAVLNHIKDGPDDKSIEQEQNDVHLSTHVSEIRSTKKKSQKRKKTSEKTAVKRKKEGPRIAYINKNLLIVLFSFITLPILTFQCLINII